MFDLSNTKAQTGFDILPAGKYVCNVTNAELADTKSGGKMIKAELTVAVGEAKGRKIFTNFNVVNANPKATEIGLGQLKSLLVNSGYKNPDKLESVTALCGLTVGVKTKIRSDETYGDKAEVHYYFDAKETKAQGLADTGSTPF
jgi:hypothetical protein